jgi:hypothetical protein
MFLPSKFTNSRDIIRAQHVRKQCNELKNGFTNIQDNDHAGLCSISRMEANAAQEKNMIFKTDNEIQDLSKAPVLSI